MDEIEGLLSSACFAADSVAIGFQGTGAEQTRAAIRAALECLIGNGMITVTPVDEWPEWVELDPPYKTN